MWHLMKLQGLVRVALVVVVCLMIPACGNSKLSKANLDKIQDGMSLTEVEDILGKGNKKVVDGINFTLVPVPGKGSLSVATTYTWESGEKKITIDFVGEPLKVARKTASGL